MEITIGVQFATRELQIQTDRPADEVQKMIEDAYANAQKLLWLTDDKGRQIGVPVDKLAYVELGSDKDKGPVGFAKG